MSDEIVMYRYIYVYIYKSIPIVSCQYFSGGARVIEGLPKKSVQTQIILLVTTNMLTLLISKKDVRLIANLKTIYENGHYEGWSKATTK